MYVPPEIIRMVPYDPFKSDVWSLGVILFAMLSGKMPFEQKNMMQLETAQMTRDYKLRDDIAKALSEDCVNTIRYCLEPDPNIRVSIGKVYAMKWLRNRTCND